MNPEQISTQPELTKESVIKAFQILAMDNPDDPDATSVLHSWVKQEEAKINAIKDPEEQTRADILFYLEHAQVYAALGFKKDAEEQVDSASELFMAEDLDDVDLANLIRETYKKIK